MPLEPCMECTMNGLLTGATFVSRLQGLTLLFYAPVSIQNFIVTPAASFCTTVAGKYPLNMNAIVFGP